MSFTALQQQYVKKLVKMHLTRTGAINPWFTRKMKGVSPEIQEEVWRQIRSKDKPKDKPDDTPTTQSETTERIYWKEDEWDKLATLVHQARKKDPVSSIGIHIQKAMEQFPAHRRRRLYTNTMGPLVERLKAKNQQLYEALELIPRLQDRITQLEQRPDSTTILTNLTDEEIRLHFGHRLADSLTDEDVPRFRQQILDRSTLDDVIWHYNVTDILNNIPVSTLVGHTITRTLEEFEANSSGLQNALITLASNIKREAKPNYSNAITAPPKPIRKPKIAILGMKPNQTQIVNSHINSKADVTFLPKGVRSSVLKSLTADIFMLWGSFCSHEEQNHLKDRAKQLQSKFVIYHGGMTNFIKRIEQELTIYGS